MNLFPLWHILSLLDIAITPRNTPTSTPTSTPTPAAEETGFFPNGILLIILLFFLIFIGCLIYNSLKKK